MDRKIIEVNGKKFEVPDLELYCEKCGTMNFFYDDDAPRTIATIAKTHWPMKNLWGRLPCKIDPSG